MLDYSFLKELADYMKTYRSHPLPVVLLDRELQVYWCNAPAKSLYPQFADTDALALALSEFPLPEIVGRVERAGSCTLAGVIPMSPVRLVFTPIPGGGKLLGLILMVFGGEAYGGNQVVYTASKKAQTLGGSIRSTVGSMFAEMDALALKSDFAGAPWVKAGLNRIGLDCYRILRVTGNLLEYARLQGGVTEPRFETIDVSAHFRLIEDALSSMSKEIGVPLDLRYPRSPALVMMDLRLIEAATLNLLHNSFYYTRPGNRVLLSVKVTPEVSTVTVKDRGAGIAKDQLLKIWQPFYCASPGSRGVGLGLPIVRAVTHMHKGSVDLISEPGQGTTVTLTLPMLSPFSPTQLGAIDSAFDIKDRFSRLYTYLADASDSPYRD